MSLGLLACTLSSETARMWEHGCKSKGSRVRTLPGETADFSEAYCLSQVIVTKLAGNGSVRTERETEQIVEVDLPEINTIHTIYHR